MPTYTIRLVCEEGPEPITGEVLDRAEESITVEADSPWAGRNRAISRMTIGPNGRLLRAYDAETGHEITPPPPADMRPGRFQIDGLAGVYEGFTRGETWNGFAVPFFLLAEARRVADDFAAQPPTPDGQTRAQYDADRDVIRLFDPSADDWDEFEPVEVDGRSLYPVGARYWTWDEVSD